MDRQRKVLTDVPVYTVQDMIDALDGLPPGELVHIGEDVGAILLREIRSPSTGDRTLSLVPEEDVDILDPDDGYDDDIEDADEDDDYGAALGFGVAY